MVVSEHPLESSNETALHRQCNAAPACIDGLLLPDWPLNDSDSWLERSYHALIYLLALAYLLFGINIITDRMISCIEVIIAQKKTVQIKTKSGEIHLVKVPVWHPVVATLTIYVIGASAAEIFLPAIELAKHHFEAHELGPALIFGSGAYHLFLITGLCVGSVKSPTSKTIEDLPVFFVTTAFAIFAYLWQYILVEWSSSNVITIWEALLTIAMFPLLVLTSWFVERRLHRKLWRRFLQCSSVVKPNAADSNDHCGDDILDVASGSMLEVEKRRRLAELLRDLKSHHPEKSELELEEMAQLQMLESVPKGAAFYRMQASKAISGGGNVISKDKIKKRLENEQHLKETHDRSLVPSPKAQVLGFDQANYTCMESCVLTVLTVRRSGPAIDETSLLVDYETKQDTAIAGSDYEETKGTLHFHPGETTADVVIKILDDDEFEDDKDFKVTLSNAKLEVKEKLGKTLEELDVDAQPVVTLGEANVRILDDDHCGVFHFESSDLAVPDNIGTAMIKVVRSTGARGRISLPFKIISGSAREGQDFDGPSFRTLTFENDQSEAVIPIKIADSTRVGEIFAFFLELGEPNVLSQPPQNPRGNPVLGQISRIKIGICEDNELAEALDRLLRLGDIADMISSTTWLDQFKDAVAFAEPTNDHDVVVMEEENASTASCDIENQTERETRCCRKYSKCCSSKVKPYILHVLSLPWKLLAACVPPAGWLHGWLAFIILLGLMAFLAALVGDLASAFGCTVGLKDTVTAITLIAFGMGLPDTFASRHAAINERTADAAIGHITGSNAVNVYLGIGMSWLMGAVYHFYIGDDFILPKTDLGFNVAVYCALATAAVVVLLLRRLAPVRGELGGHGTIKRLSSCFFVLLWLLFVLLLTLQSYCVINGF